MNPAPDFARIYTELGVSPHSGLAAFKQAYRRRVAELHPDRPASAPRDPERLIALNLGYAAALDFHRAHGRLPGAPPAGAGGGQEDARVTKETAWPDGAPPHHAPDAAAGAPWTRTVLPALILLAACWYWLPEFEAGPATVPEAPGAESAPHAPADLELQLDMDPASVSALLGEPVARDASGAHWIYGPSWVQFDCGRVSDWYSAPLRPLHVATARPEPKPESGTRRTRGTAQPRRRACLDNAHGSAEGMQQVHGGD
jgi:hypothetical protein